MCYNFHMKKLFKYSQQVITGLVLLAVAGIAFAASSPFFDGFVRDRVYEGKGYFKYGHGLISYDDEHDIHVYGYGYGYDFLDRDNHIGEGIDYAEYGFEGEDGTPTIDSVVVDKTTTTITFSTNYLARLSYAYTLNPNGGDWIDLEEEHDFNSGGRIWNLINLTCDTTYYFGINSFDAGDNRWSTKDSFTTDSCNTNHVIITGSTYSPTNTQQSTSHNPRGLRLPPITLALGSLGTDVQDLQILLNFFGTFLSSNGAGSPGEETQTFGQRTFAALKNFQRTFGLGADGIYGQKTHDVMESFLK